MLMFIAGELSYVAAVELNTPRNESELQPDYVKQIFLTGGGGEKNGVMTPTCPKPHLCLLSTPLNACSRFPMIQNCFAK